MSSTLDFRPSTVDIVARPGDDVSWRVIISDATGALLSLTGATVTVAVGAVTPTVSTTNPGIIDITLSDTQTTSLGATSVAWSLTITVGSTTTTYVAGTYTGSTTGVTTRNLVAAVVLRAGNVVVQTVAGGGSGGGGGGGGGGASTLDDLTDVVITSAATGNILRYNGTSWVNAAGTSFFETAGAVSTHAALTSGVHGISSFAATLLDDANQAAMQTTLGLVPGTNVQAQDAELAAIAALVSAANQLPYFTGSGTAALTTLSAFIRTLLDDADGATARGTLGLGTIATQAASAVAITGGSITGITDLAIADGGTGASDAATARTNLGLGTLATLSTVTTSQITDGTITPADLDPTSRIVHYFVGSRTGTLAAEVAGTNKTLRVPNRTGRTFTITSLFASVDTAPVGSAITVVVRTYNAAGTQQSTNTVTINAAANSGSTTGLSVSVADGDYFQAWPTAVGSTTAGTDLTVSAVGTWA